LEGDVFMSLVIAVGNKDFILFAGERRKTTTNFITKEVSYEEDYNKVHRINKNVLLGFGGDLAYCDEITKYLLNEKMNLREKHNLSYDQVEGFIEARFIKIVNLIEKDLNKYRKAKAYIVLGGLSDGVLKLSSYFYEDALKINKFLLESNVPKIITLTSGNYDHEKYYIEEFNKNPKIEINNLKSIFQKTVNNGIKFDESINGKVDLVQIIR